MMVSGYGGREKSFGSCLVNPRALWYKGAQGIQTSLPRRGPCPSPPPSYRLSDAQWDQLQDLLPPNGKKGGQWKDHRLMIDGILWALSDGGRWRNSPAEFGPWQSVYDRFRNWTRKGLWDRILRRLRARKMRGGEIDWSPFCIDGTAVRAHQSAAGASKNKARPGSRPTTRWAAARAGSGRSCT
jgi:transposase